MKLTIGILTVILALSAAGLERNRLNGYRLAPMDRRCLGRVVLETRLGLAMTSGAIVGGAITALLGHNLLTGVTLVPLSWFAYEQLMWLDYLRTQQFLAGLGDRT